LTTGNRDLLCKRQDFMIPLKWKINEIQERKRSFKYSVPHYQKICLAVPGASRLLVHYKAQVSEKLISSGN